MKKRKRRLLLAITLVLLTVQTILVGLMAFPFFLSLFSRAGLIPSSVMVEAIGTLGGDVAISELAAHGPETIGLLVQTLDDAREFKRAGAAETLGRMVYMHPDAVPLLRSQAAPALRLHLQATQPRVRARVALALLS
jgi:hypothetical protein